METNHAWTVSCSSPLFRLRPAGASPMAPQPLPCDRSARPAAGKTDLAIGDPGALDLAVLSVDSASLYAGMDIRHRPSPQRLQRPGVLRHELLECAHRIGRSTSTTSARPQTPASAAEGASGYGLPWWAGKRLSPPGPDPGTRAPAVPPQPALRDQLGAPGVRPGCTNCLPRPTRSPPPGLPLTDSVRTVRALEVLYATGRPLTGQRKRNPPPWRCCSNSASIQPDLPSRYRRAQRQLVQRRPARGETAALIGSLRQLCPAASTRSAIRESQAGPWPAKLKEKPGHRSYRSGRTRQYANGPAHLVSACQHQPPASEGQEFCWDRP